jgi:hypothetical protein
MQAILTFFADIAPLVLLLILIGGMTAVRQLLLARRDLGASLFSLEKRQARSRLHQAGAALSLLLLLAVAEVILVFFLVPNLPAASILTTPTLDPLATTQGTLSPEVMATLGILQAAASPTPGAVGCIPGQIDISSPRAGEELRGQVILEGSADAPNFGFYKYEYAPLGSESWAAIQAGREPVRQGELGRWDTSTITPGDYMLRLVVTDNAGNALPSCNVPVRILAP